MSQQLPPLDAAWKRPSGGKVVAGIVAVAVLALLVHLAMRVGSSPPAPEDVAADAKRACTEQFIPTRLKAPATAKFTDVEISSDTSSVGETYTVTGSVDSQNGFGALIRSKFTCIVHANGDRWVLNSATVD